MTGRRLLIGLLALGLLGAASATGFHLWRQKSEPGPTPPLIEVDRENDPALAAAVDRLRQRVLQDPHSADAWGTLGKLYLANGYRDEAIPCFERAAQLDPHQVRWPYLQGLAQRQNDLDATLRCFERAAQLAGQSGPASFPLRLRYAEALLNTGKTKEAKPLLDELLRQEPDDPRVHLALGSLAADENDLDTALSHLLRCADNPLTRQRAATHLARVYLQRADPATAERYRQRVRRLPRDPEAPDPIAEEYKGLIVGRQALFLRSEFFLRAGQVREAIELLQPLVAAHPDHVEAHVKLGMAWAKLGNYSQAETVLRQALAVSPGTVQAHYFLCVALFHQAEKSGARAGFTEADAEARKAVKLKPDHSYAHLYLGLALRKLGDNEEGIAELRQAVHFSPESTDPQLHLGEALLETGKKDEGLEHLEKAAELAGEEDPRPRAALQKWRKADKGKLRG